MNKLSELIKSRKFWAGITAILVIILNQMLDLKIPENTITQIVAIIASWIVGQALVDNANIRSKQ